MNEASSQDLLRHICSCLRARGALNKELDSLLDAAEQFNSDFDSCIDVIQGSLGSGDFDDEQNQILDRNRQNLIQIKRLAIRGIDNTDDPNTLFEMVKELVKCLSAQMNSLAVSGYDDHGLSNEGDALLKYVGFFDADEISQCWLVH